MQLHHLLVAAIGSTAIGFGQCDLLNQNFDSVGLFTPVTSIVSPISGVPKWVTAEQGGPLEPAVWNHPTSNNLALRFGPADIAVGAVRPLSDLNLPPIFRLSFDVETATNATFGLIANDGGINLVFDPTSQQIRYWGTPPSSAPMMPPGNYNSVEIVFALNGPRSVVVNGVTLNPPPPFSAMPHAIAFSSSSGQTWVDNICFTTLYATGDPIGQSYCAAVPNSTGQVGNLEAFGSSVAANNAVSLVASSLPPFEFGLFLTSSTQGFVPAAGGSMGNLCLGGAIGRYVQPGQVMNAGAAGVIVLPINLTQTPQGTGFVSVLAGQTRSWQVYHRDGISSNYTQGLSVTFQ